MVKNVVKEDNPTRKPETDSLPTEYDPVQVKHAVTAFYSALENNTSKKKSLFVDEGEFIIMQVACVKIPKVFRKQYRFTLPHGYLKDTSEVCLLVGDPREEKDYEKVVRHYKNLLSEADVKSVDEVVSYNQFTQEYNTYEMRRRLAARFDGFLCVSDALASFCGIIGKEFYSRKKIPIPFRMKNRDLKKEIDKALHKTSFLVTGYGDNYSAKVGNTKQSIEQICENIEAFVKHLMNKFPGKWGNIKSLHLHTTNRFSIPIYVAVVLPNSVKTPKVKPDPGRKLRPIDEGELSTLPDDYKVIVRPDGTVTVKSEKGAQVEDKDLPGAEEDFFDSDEEEDSDMDEDKIDDSKEDMVKEEEAETSESEEDSGVEAAEEAYLQELTMEKDESKKRKKGEEEELVTPRKMQKKLKEEESLIVKAKAKKIKLADAAASVVTAKEKKRTKEETLYLGKTSRKSKRGKGVSSSMQWQVEELDDKSTKKNNSKTKTVVKSENVDKNLKSKSVVPEPNVKNNTKTIVKSVKKVDKRESVANPLIGALNGKTKKSKLGKIVKDSTS